MPIVNSLLVDWVSVTTARIKKGSLPLCRTHANWPCDLFGDQGSDYCFSWHLPRRGGDHRGRHVRAKQRRQLDGKTPVHIIVATPGRLCELMEDETLSIFRDMAHLRYLVVDEADRIVEEGHFAEVHRIFSRIKDHEQLAVEGKSEADGGDEGKGVVAGQLTMAWT